MDGQILVVEDDLALGEQVCAQLRDAGFSVTWDRQGLLPAREQLEALRLVVLDLMLPATYGLDVLRHLRRHAAVPVLVLSARQETSDKVRALELGADDYLVKPFWPEELLARVQARLRRPALEDPQVLEVGALRLELDARVVLASGEPLELTPSEYNLLETLARRAGKAVLRAHLEERCLDPARERGERALDIHLSRLRRKLGASCLIETVWGIGYRLVAQ